MRIAVLSDIHGNLLALDAVLEDLAQQGRVDHLIVAGDLVWAGPWPREVVDRVRDAGAIVIRGNTDAFFARSADDFPDGKQAERFAAHLNWMCDRLGKKRTAYLANLPFSHRIVPAPGHDLLIVHANPRDLEQALPPGLPDAELDRLLDPERSDWAVLAFGHLHIPYARQWRGRWLVDVASVGLPMDGDPRAAYTILTWDRNTWQIEQRRVFYRVSLVAHEMRTCGMPRGKHFAERLMAARYDDFVPAMAGAGE